MRGRGEGGGEFEEAIVFFRTGREVEERPRMMVSFVFHEDGREEEQEEQVPVQVQEQDRKMKGLIKRRERARERGGEKEREIEATGETRRREKCRLGRRGERKRACSSA